MSDNLLKQIHDDLLMRAEDGVVNLSHGLWEKLCESLNADSPSSETLELMEKYCVSVRKIPEQTYSILSRELYRPDKGDKLIKQMNLPNSPVRVKRHNPPPKFGGLWMAKVLSNHRDSRVQWSVNVDHPCKTLDEAVRKAVENYEAETARIGLMEVTE